MGDPEWEWHPQTFPNSLAHKVTRKKKKKKKVCFFELHNVGITCHIATVTAGPTSQTQGRTREGSNRPLTGAHPLCRDAEPPERAPQPTPQPAPHAGTLHTTPLAEPPPRGSAVSRGRACLGLGTPLPRSCVTRLLAKGLSLGQLEHPQHMVAALPPPPQTTEETMALPRPGLSVPHGTSATPSPPRASHRGGGRPSLQGQAH